MVCLSKSLIRNQKSETISAEAEIQISCRKYLATPTKKNKLNLGLLPKKDTGG